MHSPRLYVSSKRCLHRHRTAVFAIAGLGLLWFVLSRVIETGDYGIHTPVAGDNPAPGLAALLHGQLAGYAAQQPLMGLTSVLIRLPAIAIVQATHGGALLAYRVGAAVCLLPLVGALTLYAARAKSRTEVWAVGALAIVLLVGPASTDALGAGHPEEILAGTLAVLSVLAAGRGRGAPAGVLLGLAIAAKPWALIALPAVIAASPPDVPRVVGLAAASAALLIVPPLLLDPQAYVTAARTVGAPHLVTPFSAWWSLGFPSAPGTITRHLPFGLDRGAVSSAAMLIATVLASFAAWRGLVRGHALALLALLALLRFVLDPLPLLYYVWPALAAVGAWELVTLRRAPVIAIAAALGSWGLFRIEPRLGADATNATLLVAAGALAAVLGARIVRTRPPRLAAAIA